MSQIIFGCHAPGPPNFSISPQLTDHTFQKNIHNSSIQFSHEIFQNRCQIQFFLPQNITIRTLNFFAYLLLLHKQYTPLDFQNICLKRGLLLTLRCPSLSLHAERVSWMYQSGNKHENYENQIINGGNDTVFQRIKLSKSRRLVHLWQNMIISFWMNFLLFFSRIMKHIKTKKFDEKTKLCQNHEGSCYFYYTF